MRPLIARLLALFRRRQLDDELSDEMSAHLEMSTADYVDRGMSLADARRAARLRFGGTLQTAEAYRDRQGFPLLESLWQDMRYAVRTLRRTPLFVVTVAATIGLGLGLSGSAFTILNAYLLKPIDLPNPHALYALSWDTETTRRQRFRLADYVSLGARPIYCQMASNPTIYRPHYDARPEFDVTFVGQAYGERPGYISFLRWCTAKSWLLGIGSKRSILDKFSRQW